VLQNYNMREITDKRTKVLFDMGFKFNGEELFKNTDRFFMNIHWTEITCDTDQEFDKKVEDFKKILANEEEIQESCC